MIRLQRSTGHRILIGFPNLAAALWDLRVARPGKTEPLEIVGAVGRKAGTAPEILTPVDRKGYEQSMHERSLRVQITPWGAFAAGAVVVAALALAWALGRSTAQATRSENIPAESVEELHRLPPIPYEDVLVDRGRLETPPHDL